MHLSLISTARPSLVIFVSCVSSLDMGTAKGLSKEGVVIRFSNVTFVGSL